MEVNEDELPWQEVPLHSVIKLSPKAYGCQSELINFDVPSVSTHRPKPDAPGQLDKRFVHILANSSYQKSLFHEKLNLNAKCNA